MPRKVTVSLWLLALPAILLCYLSLMIIIHFWYPTGLEVEQLQLHVIHFSIVYAFWAIILFMHNIFELEGLGQTRKVILSLASAMIVNFIVAAVYFYFQPELILTPRRFLIAHAVLTFLFLVVWNLLIRQVLNRRFRESFYLYDPGQPDLADFIAELERHSLGGWRLAGLVNAETLPSFRQETSVSLVIPESRHLPPAVMQRFYEMRLERVKFYRYQDVYESAARKVYLPSLNELWFLENIVYRESQIYRLLKRLIDLLAAISGGLVFLILYPIIAVLIKLETPGPVLFTQDRVGKYGTIFKVYKFRTMRLGAGNTWTAAGDPRITLVGRILRRLRIDELPQSWNLLIGNMSLVGPRPEQPQIVEQLRQEIPFYDERHLVKPGLTGWGQLNVYARTIEQTRTKLQYDLYYIKHRSVFLDLEIILKTLYHVITSGEV